MATVIGKEKFSDKDAEETARKLKAAMKGLGTDEQTLIAEMVGHNNKQRQLIKQKYLAFYGKTLEEAIKAELGGKFEKVLIAMLKPRYEYEAECIKNAIHAISTDEMVLIDLLCTKEADELIILKDTYKQLYNKELDNELKNKATGDLGKTLRSVSAANRPVSGEIDLALAQTEAQLLHDAGEKVLGTDESELIRILATRSFAQLNATFEKYKRICGQDIEKAIKSETSGDFEKALVAIIESVRNRPAYFAQRIRDTINGLGTKDSDLIRIIVSRSEFDLAQIRKEYLRLYNKSLHDSLKEALSGEYEMIIEALVGEE